MKKVKYIGIIFAFNCLLSACGLLSQTRGNISQNANQERTNIENLPDGNYRYCSEPDINSSDGESWCFNFNKKEFDVVGTYSYWAPKDTRQICIEGEAEGNTIVGIGYEEIEYGNTKPDIEKEKVAISNDISFTSKEGFWDKPGLPNGLNLKVREPKFYKLFEPEQTNNYYWIWVSFNYAELDLSKFYRRSLAKYFSDGKIKEVIHPEKCF